MQGASLRSARMEMGRDQLARALNRCLGCKASVAFDDRFGLVKLAPSTTHIIVSGCFRRNPLKSGMF
jgi:hypothetical protein